MGMRRDTIKRMKTIIQKASLIVFSLCLSIGVAAQSVERETIEVARLGPQVGDNVPDFNLPDQFGQYHTLEDVMGPNGAMLLFHRSADW